jgi:hypothetical protein
MGRPIGNRLKMLPRIFALLVDIFYASHRMPLF